MKKNIFVFCLLAVLTGLSAFLFSQNRHQNRDLARLQALVQEGESFRADHDEVQKLRIQAREIEGLRASQKEVIRLRNEVGTLRADKQKLAFQLQRAQKSPPSVVQNAPLPVSSQNEIAVAQPDSQASAQVLCVNNLRRLDGAVQQWALENQLQPDAKPTFRDLSPYLGGVVPTCPGGGTYTLGTVAEGPKCSIPGHQIAE